MHPERSDGSALPSGRPAYLCACLFDHLNRIACAAQGTHPTDPFHDCTELRPGQAIESKAELGPAARLVDRASATDERLAQPKLTRVPRPVAAPSSRRDAMPPAAAVIAATRPAGNHQVAHSQQMRHTMGIVASCSRMAARASARITNRSTILA